MRASAFSFLVLCFVFSDVGVVVGGSSAPENVEATAASLVGMLQELDVVTPDGARVPVILSEGAEQGLLTRERVVACVETVSEAEAWPIAWLIVQRADLDYDLVLRVALDETGAITEPEFLFTVPRREWDFDDIPRITKEATGRKPPRRGAKNLVIQGFSTKVETTYVYQARPKDGARGLEALLPSGSLIRDAESVESDQGRRTLALVVDDATHVPSTCDDCASRFFGHADSGRVGLIVADEEKILERLDLTPYLRGTNGTPLLPRHRCDDAGRALVPLLTLEDFDGDGRALELALPAEWIECGRYRGVIVKFEPGDSTLRILETRELRSE